MSAICILFNTAIDIYCELKGFNRGTQDIPGDIYFIYKGGNVMRLIFHEFNMNLSHTGAALVEDKFAKSFKKSDSDFSILIKPTVPNFETVFEDMITLSYVLQLLLRRMFNKRSVKEEGFNVFSYIEYNQDKKDMVLKEMLNKLNSSHAVSDPDNALLYNATFAQVKLMGDLYPNDGSVDADAEVPDKGSKSFLSKGGAKSDFSVDYIDNNTIAVFPLSNEKFSFYISVNRALEINTGTPERPIKFKFTLVRTKLNFSTLCIKSDGTKKKVDLDGEVIDCTVVHKDNYHNSTDQEFEHAKSLMKKYTLSGPNGGKDLEFFGYGLEGLTHDLEMILFETVDRPWKDNKYGKRINRVFFLYMIDLFTQIVNNAERINVINGYRTNVIEHARMTMNSAGSLQELKTGMQTQLPFDSRYLISRSVREIQRIALVAFDDRDNYMKMLDVLDENTQNMLNVLLDTEKYINSGAKYSNEGYHGSVASMAGGSKKPYFDVYESW